MEQVVSAHMNSYEKEDIYREIELSSQDRGECKEIITKEIYEIMTDKEKAEWIGIDSNDMQGSIKRFHKKLHSIGITYRYSSDKTEEFCRLEEINKKNSKPTWYYRNPDKKR